MAGLAWATSPQLQLGRQRPSHGVSALQDANKLRRRSDCGLSSGRNRCGSLPRRRSSATVRVRRAGLFERAATGNTDSASREVIGNPHNQTLNVAVQWGIVGVILLYAMWLVHLLLFRGEGLVAWIGLLVVVQNIFTSLFNSHIFDFHEGWMYVLGVGVAGGMTLAARQRARAAPAGSVVMAADHQRREINSIGSMLSVMASARHDPFARMLNVDLIAVLVAALLPWSTSGVAHRHAALACRSGRDARTAPVPAFVAAADLRAADCARCAGGAGNPVVGRVMGRAPLCA